MEQTYERREARRFLATPEAVTGFGDFMQRVESRIRFQKRTIVRFEWAAWTVSGNYFPEFEDLNRKDAAVMLRDMRQRVKGEGALMFKTSDGWYCEVVS